MSCVVDRTSERNKAKVELVETTNPDHHIPGIWMSRTRRRCVSVSEFNFFARDGHVQKGQTVIMSLGLW